MSWVGRIFLHRQEYHRISVRIGGFQMDNWNQDLLIWNKGTPPRQPFLKTFMKVFVENKVNVWKQRRRQTLRCELNAFKPMVLLCRWTLAKIFFWDPENMRFSRQYISSRSLSYVKWQRVTLILWRWRHQAPLNNWNPSNKPDKRTIQNTKNFQRRRKS